MRGGGSGETEPDEGLDGIFRDHPALGVEETAFYWAKASPFSALTRMAAISALAARGTEVWMRETGTSTPGPAHNGRLNSWGKLDCRPPFGDRSQAQAGQSKIRATCRRITLGKHPRGPIFRQGHRATDVFFAMAYCTQSFARVTARRQSVWRCFISPAEARNRKVCSARHNAAISPRFFQKPTARPAR